MKDKLSAEAYFKKYFANAQLGIGYWKEYARLLRDDLAWYQKNTIPTAEAKKRLRKWATRGMGCAMVELKTAIAILDALAKEKKK